MAKTKKDKKGQSKNYLDYIPVKNPEIKYETGEDGIVVVYLVWNGFYHKMAQKFFHRPKVSEIRLDKYGSFVWNTIDDVKDVHELSLAMDQEFPGMEKGLSRLIKFLEILHDRRLIFWKGEEHKC